MQYYLRHYFNPDFDYLNLKPGDSADGKQGLYTFGYAQNVITGQLLAEIIPLEQLEGKPDPRFVLDKPELPVGPNTRVDPAYPNYLLSDAKAMFFTTRTKLRSKAC